MRISLGLSHISAIRRRSLGKTPSKSQNPQIRNPNPKHLRMWFIPGGFRPGRHLAAAIAWTADARAQDPKGGPSRAGSYLALRPGCRTRWATEMKGHHHRLTLQWANGSYSALWLGRRHCRATLAWGRAPPCAPLLAVARTQRVAPPQLRHHCELSLRAPPASCTAAAMRGTRPAS
jgi:hypothetical protein